MPLPHSVTVVFLYTTIYNHNIKFETYSMATRGRFTAALNTVLLFEAFSGVLGNVVQRPPIDGRDGLR